MYGSGISRERLGRAADGLPHHRDFETAGAVARRDARKADYFIGSLMLGSRCSGPTSVFCQYFIIWNANIPEETFWYVLREKGTWWDVSMIIIFFHFFLPFLMLLRIDWKLKVDHHDSALRLGWLMHFFDVAFNVLPAGRPDGYSLNWAWLDLGCWPYWPVC